MARTVGDNVISLAYVETVRPGSQGLREMGQELHEEWKKKCLTAQHNVKYAVLKHFKTMVDQKVVK